MTPTLKARNGGRCCWALSDKNGWAYPCERPSAGEVVDAPEGWAGIYCQRHLNKALRGARHALLEEAEMA